MSVTRPATGVGVTDIRFGESGAPVLVGNTANDGKNALQVTGSARAANYKINDEGPGASGLVGMYNGDNGPNIAFYGKSTAGGGALTFSAGGAERARITAGGALMVGTSAPPAGASPLTVGSQMVIYSAANDSCAAISAASYGGGIAIEAFDGANKVKKNIVLNGWGGRVLVGQGVSDDGASVLRVQGQAAINGNAIVAGNLTAFANITGTTQYRQGLEGDGTSTALYNDPGKRNFVIRSGPDGSYKFTQVTEAGDLLSPGGGYFTTVVSVPQLYAEGSTDLATASLWLNHTGQNARKYSMAARGTGELAFSDETAGATRFAIKPDGKVSVANSLIVGGNVAAGEAGFTTVGASGQIGITMTNTTAGTGKTWITATGPGGAYNVFRDNTSTTAAFSIGANDGDTATFNRPLYVSKETTLAGRVWMRGGTADNSAYGEIGLKRTGDGNNMYMRGWPDPTNVGVQFVNNAYNDVVSFVDNGGNIWLAGKINFRNGAELQGNGNLLMTWRNRWLSDDMAKMDDAWNKANDAQVNRADRGAQCQHSADGNEFASINVGYAHQTADAGNPWVLTGMRSQNGSNVTYLRCGWLRNN